MLPDNMMELTVMMFRALMIPMLVYNLAWSWPRFKNLLKGYEFFDVHYGSTVFLACLPLLGFQLTALGDLEDVGVGPLTLTFVMMFFLMNVVTIIGHVYERKIGVDRFQLLKMSRNVSIAARTAAIHEIEPELVERLLVQAENTIASRVLEQNV